MGYVPPKPPTPALNLDRFGMPRDYATYVWLLYGKRVEDKSPERQSFLRRGNVFIHHSGAWLPILPEPDHDLIDTMRS